MSKETDDKIDSARDKLLETSRIAVGMGNYKQVRRAYEEVILELTNAIDAINAEMGE
jgi:hypothetical protein